MKKYNETYIKELIEKFMAGRTSLEEERLLDDYFRTEEVPEEWADYQKMFAYFDDGMPSDLSQHTRSVSHKRPWIWMAAACIVLLITSGTYLYTRQSRVTETENTKTELAQENTSVHQVSSTNTTIPAKEIRVNQSVLVNRHLAKARPSMEKIVSTPSHIHARPDSTTVQEMEALAEELAQINTTSEETVDRSLKELHQILKSHGYQPVSDENGSIIYAKSTNKNVIEL